MPRAGEEEGNRSGWWAGENEEGGITRSASREARAATLNKDVAAEWWIVTSGRDGTTPAKRLAL